MASTDDAESLSERQENELEVLKAIYVDDVSDLREGDAWKVARPPEICIKLRPQESMTNREGYSSVDLYIKCGRTYPELVPHIELNNPKGISNQNVAALKAELYSLAKSLIGEVMILELAQHVQTFLHTHDKPPTKSFYDEMMTSKKRQEEREAKEQQEILARMKQNEEKKQRKINEEIHRRQEALKEESRRIRQEAKQGALDRTSSSDPSTGSESLATVTPIAKDTEQRKRSSVTPERQSFISDSGSYHKNERRKRTTSTPKRGDSESDGDITKCNNHTGVSILEFNTKKERNVHRGKCLGHSLRGCTTYAGMDTHTGELVTITEWQLQWRKPKRKLDVDDQRKDNEEAAVHCKQVAGIESEFMSLLRLSHRNLVHYLAFKYTQNLGCITVNVLSEHISGGSLKGVLSGRMPVPVEHLRLYTIQLVDVLYYLHGKAVVHKNLRPSSIMLESNGHLRLGDYSIDNRLAEMYAACDADRPGVHFADDKPLVPGRGGKKADIYMLGVMLLSLAQGVIITDEDYEIPTSLPQELSDFLNKCLIRDEHIRWSAAQLMDHTFVKTPIHRVLNEGKIEKKPEKHKNKDLDDEEEDELRGLIPYIPSSEGGQSRLKNEFEIIRWLGKGGFGDVIKVRNKLDGRFYAIKRIPLNPRSKHFTRKITREVKLLSRLNHENVVRYYNSWIEVSEDPAPSDCTNSTIDTPQSPSPARPQVVAKTPTLSKIQEAHFNSLGLRDVDFSDAPPPAAAAGSSSMDWSISLSSSQHVKAEESSSDEDEEDEDDTGDVFGMSFGASFLAGSDSDSVIFDHDDEVDCDDSVCVFEETGETSSSKSPEKGEECSTVVETIPKLQFLYIQMEFCEKSTLRDCIDAGLYLDRDRVWRLFREICEGLHHIHLQGMIHRDLKPVNIFLDYDDQVKIGDFGLATTDIISQQQSSLLDLNITPALNLDPRLSSSKSESLGDGNLTGKVGTALYVSPEMMGTSTRTHYNQKVDIYSLGVIFFEMSYRPLSTGMERVQVLTALREPSITLPADFDAENEMQNEVGILKWILDHDPAARPTVEQLLASELLPPPKLEEAELTEVLRSTLAQPDTKGYRHMMSAIFSQRVDPATDFTFDIDLHKIQAPFSPDPLLVQRSVIESLERVFEKRGALRLNTPLLMPKSVLYESCDQYVCMMDYSGGLVALPYDLRVPFARFVARNNVTNLKRFSLDKVYRQKRFFNLHPRELVECAFDIVTPSSSSLMPDAEIIHVVSDIIKEFPALQERNYFLRLNHAFLLRGILLHCGVPDELYNEVCNILSEMRAERHQKLQVGTRLGALSLSDDVIMNLYRFIETEGPYGKVASMMRCITKTKGVASSFAKQGLHEMEAIISHADALGCKLQPVLAIGLVYNMHYYSGAVFQIVATSRRKNRTAMEVLAAGGRYDNLIARFHKPCVTLGHQSTPPLAVGISISFERLIVARQEQEEWQSRGMVDVVVASLGHKPLNKEKLGTASELLAAGLRTNIVYETNQSLEEIQEAGRQMGASQIVLLKDLDSGYAKVRTLDKDKVTEKKVHLGELTKYVQQKVAALKCCEVPESSNVESSMELRNSGQTISSSGGGSTSMPTINITLVTVEKKIASNTKRRYEAQIYNNITSAVTVISNKMRVEVLGVELASSVLKTIAANIEINQDEAEFEDSIQIIMDKHARRDDKKYLNKIFEEIHDLKFMNERSLNEMRNISSKPTVIIIYGLKDDSYRVLL